MMTIQQLGIKLSVMKERSVKESEELRREKMLLAQKVELLEAELKDYELKQAQTRKLNESLMITYRLNQSAREQYGSKQLQNMASKHAEEIKHLKAQHEGHRRRLEEQAERARQENQRLKVELERTRLESEKRIDELESSHTKKMRDKLREQEKVFQQRISDLNEELIQSRKMAEIYNEFVSKRRESAQDYLYEADCKKAGKERRRQCSLASLTNRINRAMVQLKPGSIAVKQVGTRKRLI